MGKKATTILRFNLIIVVGLLCHAALLAQPTFTAFADAKDVLLNNYFEVTFTLENGEGTQFMPPDFGQFSVLSGPNQSFQTTIVNGRMSQKQSFGYRLQPRKPGQFTIGAAKITVAGKTLRSQPLTVRVVQGGSNPDSGKEEVFIRAKLTETTAYLGQQLLLDYWLYYRVDVDGLNASSESDYAGFFMRDVHQYDKRPIREVINGAQYNAQIIKRVALYPQQTGAITISPLSVVVGIPVPGTGGTGLFSRPELKRIVAESKPITVQVRPLPPPTIARFDDVVGDFAIQAGLSRSTMTTDDALVLTLAFEGAGDLKRIQPPKLAFPPEFEQYDPKAVSEEYFDLSDGVKGRKVFEYLLVPTRPGKYTISPKIGVFDPKAAAYKEINLTPMVVDVQQGTGKSSGGGLVADATAPEAASEPRQIRLTKGLGTGFFGTPLYWALLLLPVMVAGGFVTYRNRRAALTVTDPAALRLMRAKQQAEARLKAADAYRMANDSRGFYAEVERALLGYIGDKLGIPRADMTKRMVQEKLTELGASETQTARFQTLVRNCEMALYAGMDNAAAMETTYHDSVKLLAEVEEVLG